MFKQILDQVLGFITGKYILIIVVLLGIIFFQWKWNNFQKEDRRRLNANVENITREGIRQLDLKRSEYDKLNTEWKDKLDSTIKKYDLKLKQVKSAIIIKTEYRDTGSVKVLVKTIIEPTKGNFIIPLSYDNQCWGFKAEILSKDSTSQFKLIERSAANSVQLLVVRKRFMGFLWWKKKTDFKAFNDCGNVDITDIKFK